MWFPGNLNVGKLNFGNTECFLKKCASVYICCFISDVRYSAHCCRELEGDKTVCGPYKRVRAEFVGFTNVVVLIVVHNICVCVHICVREWCVHNYSA